MKCRTTALAALLFTLVITSTAVAQGEPLVAAPNAVSFEVGGPGGFYSLNYDRQLTNAFAVRAGGTSWGTMSFDKQREKVAAAIVGAFLRVDISDLVGRGAGRFAEAGAALTIGTHSRYTYDTVEADGAFTTFVPMVGIRFQPPSGGFMYRATFTPYVPLSGGEAQYPHEGIRTGASLGVGYAF